MPEDDLFAMIAAHENRRCLHRFTVDEVLILRLAFGVVLDQDDSDTLLRDFVQTEHDTLLQRLAELHPGLLAFQVLSDTEERTADAEPVELIEEVLAQYSDKTLRYEQSVWNSLMLQEVLTLALQSPTIPDAGRTFLMTCRTTIHDFLRRLDPRFLAWCPTEL